MLDRAPCRHHWIVDSLPQANAYPAQCRHCHARRRFPRIMGWFDFNDFLPSIDDVRSAARTAAHNAAPDTNADTPFDELPDPTPAQLDALAAGLEAFLRTG